MAPSLLLLGPCRQIVAKLNNIIPSDHFHWKPFRIVTGNLAKIAWILVHDLLEFVLGDFIDSQIKGFGDAYAVRDVVATSFSGFWRSHYKLTIGNQHQPHTDRVCDNLDAHIVCVSGARAFARNVSNTNPFYKSVYPLHITEEIG